MCALVSASVYKNSYCKKKKIKFHITVRPACLAHEEPVNQKTFTQLLESFPFKLWLNMFFTPPELLGLIVLNVVCKEKLNWSTTDKKAMMLEAIITSTVDIFFNKIMENNDSPQNDDER